MKCPYEVGQKVEVRSRVGLEVWRPRTVKSVEFIAYSTPPQWSIGWKEGGGVVVPLEANLVRPVEASS